MLYRVCWRDGSTSEGKTFEESMKLIEAKPENWASVQFMENGNDCHPDNAKAKEVAWGNKKKK